MEAEELIKRVMQNITNAIENTPRTSDPLMAIEKTGVKLIRLNLSSAYGVMMKGKESYIFINNHCSQEKESEVAWHELGHYLMHDNTSVDVAEIEANLYSFIMTQIVRGVQLWNS